LWWRSEPAEARSYLATVIDLSSRRVVGWALADHMRTELVEDALAMAFAQRRPAAGVIFHSDYAEVGVKPENLRMAWSGSPADGFPGLTFLVTGDCREPVAGLR